VSRDLSTHIKREVVMNGVMNVICNGGITWLLLKGGKPLVLVGIPSIGVDLAATGAIMLFIIALIFIPLNHRKMVKGDLESLRWQAGNRLHGLLQRFPQSLLLRGLYFALVGLLIFTPVTVALLSLAGIEQLAPLNYSIFKGIWSGIVAALMTGPMIMLGAAPKPSAGGE
jgi:hypothetical protein